MKKRFVHIFVYLFLVSAVIVAYIPGQADVGNFNDYDGGSSSDWSSSDWDNSDWGDSSNNSDGGGFIYFGGGDSGSGGGGFGSIAAAIIAVLIIAYILNKRSKGGAKPKNIAPQTIIPADNTEKILSAVTLKDAAFNKEKFIGWTKEVFITLQTAWMQRDWAKIRPFEKEELYRQHELQLQEYIQNGRINVIERINVNQAYLHKYERDKDYEQLTVYMQVRMVDYIKDEKTGAVLKGNPNEDCRMKYLLTFMRRNGVLTNSATSNKSTVSCPNCGAPVNITSAGKCEYCGSIVVTGDFDWVLSDIEAVKPGMQIDNTGVVIRGEQ